MIIDQNYQFLVSIAVAHCETEKERQAEAFVCTLTGHWLPYLTFENETKHFTKYSYTVTKLNSFLIQFGFRYVMKFGKSFLALSTIEYRVVIIKAVFPSPFFFYCTHIIKSFDLRHVLIIFECVLIHFSVEMCWMNAICVGKAAKKKHPRCKLWLQTSEQQQQKRVHSLDLNQIW